MFFSSLTILIVYTTSCGTLQVIPLNIDTNSTPSSSSYDYFLIEHPRLENMRNSFLRVALKGWNSLPSRIRKIWKHTFKNRLKHILLEILGIVLIINKRTLYHSTYSLKRSLNNSLPSEVNEFVGPSVNRSGAKPREFERKIYLNIYIFIYRWRCPWCCLVTVQTKFEWHHTKGRLLGSNRLEDSLASDAICSCYATEPVSAGSRQSEITWGVYLYIICLPTYCYLATFLLSDVLQTLFELLPGNSTDIFYDIYRLQLRLITRK